jgi:short-subunit dehydrogenase
MDETHDRKPAARRPLAAITNASSGIGLELARRCGNYGFDLLVCANQPEIEKGAEELRATGSAVTAVEADLSTQAGVDEFHAAAGTRPIEALLANPGAGLGHAFLDQDFEDIRRVLDTNVTGTAYLIHRIGRQMRARGHGRILLTGSIGGLSTGRFSAVYGGAKAFLDSFSFALRDELQGCGVTVTSLVPGPADADLFSDSGSEDYPARVAAIGFEAMMNGEGDVVAGWKEQATAPAVTQSGVVAERHRSKTTPERSAERR